MKISLFYLNFHLISIFFFFEIYTSNSVSLNCITNRIPCITLMGRFTKQIH